jgi:hypothetical protein
MTDNIGCKLNCPCAICGGDLVAVRLTHSEPDRFEKHVGIGSAEYRRDWIECCCCGCCTNVMPTSNLALLAELAQGYYEVDFAGTTIADKFSMVMALPERLSDNAARVERICNRIKLWRTAFGAGNQLIRILDIGAGTGVFLAKIMQQSSELLPFEAVAFEPDPIAAEHLRSIGGFEVIESCFEHSKAGAGYNLITLNKVIEHLPEPASLLADISSVCDSDFGLVYVEVPDTETIEFRSPSDNILGALHHHLFTPAGLSILFEKCGLKVLDIARVVEPSGKITVYGFACPASAFINYVASGGDI